MTARRGPRDRPRCQLGQVAHGPVLGFLYTLAGTGVYVQAELRETVSLCALPGAKPVYRY